MTQHTRRPSRPTSRVQRDVRRAIAVLGAGALLIGLINIAQSVFKESPSQVTAAGPNSQSSDSPTTTAKAAAGAAGSSDSATTPTTLDSGALTQPAEQDAVGDEPS